jgi:LacI family transcriptional regulator
VSVTINEIAQLARVSKSTVSRVINESGPVSEKTKRAVLDAIESADFRPSHIARSLTLKRTNTIGLVVQDIRNPFYSLACWYAERFFRRYSYITIMCNMCNMCDTDNEFSVERSVFHTLRKHSVDGILWVGGEQGCSVLDGNGARGLPIVTVGREVQNGVFTSVVLDNEYGGQLAVEYLFAQGHRRIAFVTSDNTASERLRHQGYVNEHRTHGVPVDRDLVISLEEAQWHRGELNRILRIFSLNDRPTALFASNDYKAFQVMRLFRKNGVSVPGDISLIGFDDIDTASMVHPALTTIHQPIDQMVEEGSRLLLNLLEGGGAVGERKVLRPWLVERESVTAPHRQQGAVKRRSWGY